MFTSGTYPLNIGWLEEDDSGDSDIAWYKALNSFFCPICEKSSQLSDETHRKEYSKESELNDGNWKVYLLTKCPVCEGELKNITYLKSDRTETRFSETLGKSVEIEFFPQRHLNDERFFEDTLWTERAKKLLKKLDLEPGQAYLNFFIRHGTVNIKSGGDVKRDESFFVDKRGAGHLNLLDKLAWKRFVKFNYRHGESYFGNMWKDCM